MSNAEKLKALKLTMDKIDKDFGKGSVMMMNEKPRIRTGSDFYRFYWFGCGTWVLVVYQREGLLKFMDRNQSGKTTLPFM